MSFTQGSIQDLLQQLMSMLQNQGGQGAGQFQQSLGSLLQNQNINPQFGPFRTGPQSMGEHFGQQFGQPPGSSMWSPSLSTIFGQQVGGQGPAPGGSPAPGGPGYGQVTTPGTPAPPPGQPQSPSSPPNMSQMNFGQWHDRAQGQIPMPLSSWYQGAPQ